MNFKKLTIILTSLATIFTCGSCEKPNNEQETPLEGDVTLVPSINAIKSDAKDICKFTIMVGDAVLTEGGDIYDVQTSQKLSSHEFTSDKIGEYKFFASYKGRLSEQITVSVLKNIPDLVEDTQKENTNFKHRVLGMQFTGTACRFCPNMKAAIKDVEKKEIAKNAVFTAIHSFNSDDIMYSKASGQIGQLHGNGSYPAFGTDMRRNVFNNYHTNELIKKIEENITNDLKEIAKAGISVATEVQGDKIVISSEVKSSEDQNYRIAAWVLEDKIEAAQTGENPRPEYDMNIHDDVFRACSTSNNNYTGDNLGFIKTGSSKKYVMNITISEKWKLENCRIIVFVTSPDFDAPTKFYVSNVVTCPLNGTMGYEYNK